jgi:hypothetical protein
MPVLMKAFARSFGVDPLVMDSGRWLSKLIKTEVIVTLAEGFRGALTKVGLPLSFLPEACRG